MKIKTLNQDTINKIAAGEVIVRPASVVKELVENSIDAGASWIRIEVEEGGKRLIKITDNGCGISYDDIPLAFKRHATSKINFLEDLDSLRTMGFRGEALSSIAAVADIKITTIADEEEVGSYTEISEGDILKRTVIPFEKGTDIEISDLFKSIPARFKFLKKDQTEEKHIRDIIQKLTLAHPEIAFTYISDGRKKFKTSGNGKLLDSARNIFGFEFASNFHEFSVDNSPMRVYGLIGDLNARRNNKENQIFFLNHRFIKSPLLSAAFEEAWEGKLMLHQHPSGVIFVDLPPNMIDVNVHPQKTEIRILNKSLVTLLFKQSIKETLKTLNLIPDITSESDEEIQETEILEEKTELTLDPLQEKFTDFFEDNSTYTLTVKEIPEETKNIDIPALDELIPKKKEEPEETSFRTAIKPFKIEGLRLIGVAFNTYILLEGEGNLYIIDQHAAHEAILYETFSKSFRENLGFQSQGLLVPINVPATLTELEKFNKVKDKLEKFGFKVEAKKDHFEISSVPVINNIRQNPELVIPLLNWFSGDDQLAPDIGLRRIVTASCKAAVKAGDSLEEAEINELLKKLSKLDNPYTCPHGRPVILKRREYEFKKLFKRAL